MSQGWGSIIAAAILATPSILAWVESRRNRKAIADVHDLVNSQTTLLVETATKAATAEGKAMGVSEERERHDKKN